MIYTTAGLIKYLSHFSYPWMIAYFGFFGYLFPLPDEGVFVVFGYLSGLGKFNFGLVILFSVIGVLLADNVFYWLSFKESHHLLKFKQKIKIDVLTKYENLMERNIGMTMIILRLFVGFRFLGPVIAGSLKIKWHKFFLYDLAITTCYMGIFMYVGYFFRQRLPLAISLVERFHSVLLSGVAIVVFLLFLRLILKKS